MDRIRNGDYLAVKKVRAIAEALASSQIGNDHACTEQAPREEWFGGCDCGLIFQTARAIWVALKPPPTEVSSPETADRLLAHLRELAGEGGCVTISARAAGRALGIARTTANRAFHMLVERGDVEITRPGVGLDYPTTYRILGRSARLDVR